MYYKVIYIAINLNNILMDLDLSTGDPLEEVVEILDKSVNGNRDYYLFGLNGSYRARVAQRLSDKNFRNCTSFTCTPADGAQALELSVEMMVDIVKRYFCADGNKKRRMIAIRGDCCGLETFMGSLRENVCPNVMPEDSYESTEGVYIINCQ